MTYPIFFDVSEAAIETVIRTNSGNYYFKCAEVSESFLEMSGLEARKKSLKSPYRN